MSELAGGDSKLKQLFLPSSRGLRKRRHAAAEASKDDAADEIGRQPLKAPQQQPPLLNVIEHRREQATHSNETATAAPVGLRDKEKQAEHPKAPAVSQDGAHTEHKVRSAGAAHSEAQDHKQEKHQKLKQSGKNRSSQVAGSSSKSHVNSSNHSIGRMQPKSEHLPTDAHQESDQTRALPSASTETNSTATTTTSVEAAKPFVTLTRLGARLSFSPDGPIASAARHQIGETPTALALTSSASPEGAGSSEPAGGQPLNYLMLIGLPIYACVMFGLILLLVVKYCQKVRRTFKEKQPHNSATKGKGSNKIKKFISSPIGFISNGKALQRPADSSAKAVKSVKGAKESTAAALPAAKDDQKKALDCRQLTINMEENSDNLSTEDSDEQQTSHDGISASCETNKPTKPKSKSSKLGMLKYSLEYDFNRSILTVSVHEARELPVMDLNGSSDPYVNVYMANNKNYQAFRTKVHKRTLNPVFNETFSYHISYVELAKQTLILSVYDYDKLSRHDEIGQLTLPMNSIDLTQRQVNWSELRKMNDASEGRLGDICLSLRYVPTAGRLNVVILEARQLKKMDVAGLSDPYVKLALMSQGKRVKKKKTSIKKCTLNPHFNESFSFEVPFEQAQKVQLVITVVDYDRIGTSEPIGKITLGCEQATGETEQRHWMDMLASPRRPIARWHTLHNVDFEPKIPVLSRRLSQFISIK